MSTVLFESRTHKCIMYSDLGGEENDVAVQSNQFLIVDDGVGAVIDPGGQLTYSELYMDLSKHFPPRKLAAVIASHADPDIVGALNRWMVGSEAQLYISKIWARFVPHICTLGKTEGRIVSIGDEGMHIKVGSSTLIALPAHFLHSEGNFQFYDTTSKILFSGDLGTSIGTPRGEQLGVKDFDEHIGLMQGFHKRYMVSRKVMALWAKMVRTLDIEAIVPQHGRPFLGKPMVNRFIQWCETFDCGVDLLTEYHYRVPSANARVQDVLDKGTAH